MDENNKENNNLAPSSNADLDDVMNLANNLMKNESTIDMSSIMRMATNLLNDDSLMNSVKQLGMVNQTPAQDVPNAAENQEKNELIVTSEQMAQLINDVSDIKRDLLNVMKQNELLLKLLQNDDKKEKKEKKKEKK